MMSKNFNTSSDLYYVNNSYETIGNNGNCYNSYISNTNCSGEYSQNLRNALIEFSDHLPVVMEIETLENTLTTSSINEINFIGSNLTEDYLDMISNENIDNFKIYAITGQLIKVIFTKKTSDNSVRIDVRHISKGIYYLSHQKLKKPLKFIKI